MLRRAPPLELGQMDTGARSDIATATVIVTDVTLDKRQLHPNLVRYRSDCRFISPFCIHYPVRVDTRTNVYYPTRI